MRRLHIRVDLPVDVPEHVRHSYTPSNAGWMIPIEEDVTIEGLAAAITQSYRNRVKEPELDIIEVQDGYGCSLDMGYSVGDVFEARETTGDSRNYTAHVIRGPLTKAELTVINAYASSPASTPNSSHVPGSSVRIPKRSLDCDFTFFPAPAHPFKRRKVAADAFQPVIDSEPRSSVDREESRKNPLHSSQLYRTVTPAQSEHSDGSIAGVRGITDASNHDFLSAPQSPRNESPMPEPQVAPEQSSPPKALSNRQPSTITESASAATAKPKKGRPRKSDVAEQGISVDQPSTSVTNNALTSQSDARVTKKPRKKKLPEGQDSQKTAPTAKPATQNTEETTELGQDQSQDHAADVKPAPKNRKKDASQVTTLAANEQPPPKKQKKASGSKKATAAESSNEQISANDEKLENPSATKASQPAKPVGDDPNDVAASGLPDLQKSPPQQPSMAAPHTISNISSQHQNADDIKDEKRVPLEDSEVRPDGEQDGDQPTNPAADPEQSTADTKEARKKKKATMSQYIHDLTELEVPPGAILSLKEKVDKKPARKPPTAWYPGKPGRPPKNAQEIIDSMTSSQLSQEAVKAIGKRARAAITAQPTSNIPGASDLNQSQTGSQATPAEQAQASESFTANPQSQEATKTVITATETSSGKPEASETTLTVEKPQSTEKAPKTKSKEKEKTNSSDDDKTNHNTKQPGNKSSDNVNGELSTTKGKSAGQNEKQGFGSPSVARNQVAEQPRNMGGSSLAEAISTARRLSIDSSSTGSSTTTNISKQNAKTSASESVKPPKPLLAKPIVTTGKQAPGPKLDIKAPLIADNQDDLSTTSSGSDDSDSGSESDAEAIQSVKPSLVANVKTGVANNKSSAANDSPKPVKLPQRADLSPKSRIVSQPKKTDSLPSPSTSSSGEDSEDEEPTSKPPSPAAKPPPKKSPASSSKNPSSTSRAVLGSAAEHPRKFSDYVNQAKQPPYKNPVPGATSKPAAQTAQSEQESSGESSSSDDQDDDQDDDQPEVQRKENGKTTSSFASLTKKR